jgi:hypothetical protein
VIQFGTDADALRAIESWLSRVYGRPTERVEVDDVREPESYAELRAMSEAERLALAHRLEAEGRVIPLSSR